MSRLLSSGEITVEMDQEIFCFLAEPESLGEIPEDDEPVPINTRVIGSLFQLKRRKTSGCPQ